MTQKMFRLMSESSAASDRWAALSSYGSGNEIDEELEPVITTVAAQSLEHALGLAATDPRHAGRRVVHVEETFPDVVHTDAAISEALRNHLQPAEIDPETFAADDVPLLWRDGRDDLWQAHSVLSLVVCVAEALDEQRLLPGLRIRCDAPTTRPSTVVAVGVPHPPVGCVYRFAPLHDLTDDPDAVGWDGLLAVARELLRIGSALH